MHPSRLVGLPVAIAAALLASLAGAGGAAADTPDGPVTTVGKPRLAFPGAGSDMESRHVLLVPARYPLYMKGRRATVRVEIGSRGRMVRAVEPRERISAGLPREGADLRRSFRFTHAVQLPDRLVERLLRRDGSLDLQVFVYGILDVDEDGRPEQRTGDVVNLRVRPPRANAAVRCASLPVLHVKTRGNHVFGTPRCTQPMRWSFATKPEHGDVRRPGRTFEYRSDRGHRGPDGFVLRGVPAPARRVRPGSGARSATTVAGRTGPGTVEVPVHLQVGSGFPSRSVVRAIGDSVTAGFGYFNDRRPMTLSQLLSCKPGNVLNDACSSNSLNLTNTDGTRPIYAFDYGLSNVIAWPARWAGWNGITNFANYAVTGSAPADWKPGGAFYPQLRAATDIGPDYIVFTVGANPLLSDVLFGLDTMKCAIWSDLFGDFTRCVTDAFASVQLAQNLRAVYAELLGRTPGRTQILAMQYPLSIPASALAYSTLQLERMEELLNQQIVAAAASFNSPRLRTIAPPRFNVGIDMQPLYPSNISCSSFGYRVDGPSVQSTDTQIELRGLHPLSFCKGPMLGEPWIISADTGIHPSVNGHGYMANALPTPP